jgi:4'-phosphopantetheinyl transferase
VSLNPGAVQLVNSDPEIVFVDLDASFALLEAEEARVSRLGASDIVRAARFADDPRRQALWRAARIATRVILERSAGPAMRGVDFEIVAGGRPALGAGMPHFSISHTAGVALIAVSQIGPLGVDVESLRTLSMNADRRRRIIAAAGAFASDASLDANSNADVLRAWVNLEAVAKARGSGIGALLTEEGVIGGASTQSVAHAGLAVATLDVPAPYIAAVAATELPQSIPVRTFPSNADELDAFLARSAG